MDTKTDTSLVDAISRLVAGNHNAPLKGSFAHGAHPVAPYVIVPQGYEVQTLSPAPEAPLPGHIIAGVTLNDTRSFVHYVNAFKVAATHIFLDAAGKFVAVVDYHRPADGRGSTDLTDHHAGIAEHTAHRVTFPLTHSEPWRFWAALHDKWLTQETVIEIIEGRRADISQPSDAALLACASELRAGEGVEFVSRYERNNGQSVLVRKEATVNTTDNSIKVVNDLTLTIPCFTNGEPVQITVLISWEGKPARFVKFRLLELERIRDEEIVKEAEVVRAQTLLPVLLGTPPATPTA